MPDLLDSEPESSALVRQLRAIGRIEPSPAAAARVRVAIARAATPRSVEVASRWRLSWRRPAVAVAFAVGLLTVGSTSALASADALPNSPLYVVRGVREELQVRLAGGPGQRARLYASFAAARSSQLQQLLRERRAEAGVVGTLLHDISSEVQHANQEARDDGQSARNNVQQAEGQIGQQLNQLQQEGAVSGADGATLSDTLRNVQSGETGQSGDSGNQP